MTLFGQKSKAGLGTYISLHMDTQSRQYQVYQNQPCCMVSLLHLLMHADSTCAPFFRAKALCVFYHVSSLLALTMQCSICARL